MWRGCPFLGGGFLVSFLEGVESFANSMVPPIIYSPSIALKGFFIKSIQGQKQLSWEMFLFHNFLPICKKNVYLYLCN
jgi:hypothetical protein